MGTFASDAACLVKSATSAVGTVRLTGSLTPPWGGIKSDIGVSRVQKHSAASQGRHGPRTVFASAKHDVMLMIYGFCGGEPQISGASSAAARISGREDALVSFQLRKFR